MQANEVLTIGHSTLQYGDFLQLLRNASVTAVADVRSAPYSRQQPQFNRENLQQELRKDGIAYVFLGKELGGRPSNRALFCDGVADYERMAETSAFLEGVSRVIDGAKKFRIALMCSERHPLNCHRCLLVGRVLTERGVQVNHILGPGQTVSQASLEKALLEETGRGRDDFFNSKEELLAAAYRERSKKVAFSASDDPPTSKASA